MFIFEQMINIRHKFRVFDSLDSFIDNIDEGNFPPFYYENKIRKALSIIGCKQLYFKKGPGNGKSN